MIKVSYEGWLTEQKLIKISQDAFGASNIRSGILPDRRFRYDVIIDSCKRIIEFDGDGHYSDVRNIYNDLAKDEHAKIHGYSVIRIPYFVQLTNQTSKMFLGVEAEVEQKFPHGFVSEKCILPATFCVKGLERYIKELKYLPENIQNDIEKSLKIKETVLRTELVRPDKEVVALLNNRI